LAGADLYGQLDDFQRSERRARRIEALLVQQMLAPSSTLARRQYNLIQRSQPKATPQQKLPRFDFQSIKNSRVTHSRV